MQLKILTLKENQQEAPYNTPDCQQLLTIYEDYYSKVAFEPPWVAYMVMKEGQVVGSCSFVQPPKEGQVEIAYWTFQEFEGQGVASFACQELIKIAQEANPNLTLIAKTAPEKNASTSILEKNGFHYSKIVQDEDIGDAWLWVLEK